MGPSKYEALPYIDIGVSPTRKSLGVTPVNTRVFVNLEGQAISRRLTMVNGSHLVGLDSFGQRSI